MSSSLVMLLISTKLWPGISPDIVPPDTSKAGWVPRGGRSPASAAGWPYTQCVHRCRREPCTHVSLTQKRCVSGFPWGWGAETAATPVTLTSSAI